MRTLFLLGAAAALVGSVVGGCSSSQSAGRQSAQGGSSGGSCVPGQTRSCTCPTTAMGAQVCGQDSTWGVCNGCGGGVGGAGPVGGSGGIGGAGAVGGAGGAGVGGSGATGFGGSSGGPTTQLGRACVSDAECGTAGLVCLTQTSGALDGASPPRGLCTAECSADATLCSGYGPGAICLNFGTTANPAAYCVESCTFGPDSLTDFNATKCHGRQEVACTPLSDQSMNTIPACVPQCNADADCTPGFCNPESGLCTSTSPQGASTGAPCTPAPDGGVDTCRGSCITFNLGTTGTTSMCAEGCTTGALPACGWNGPGTGNADAFCLYTFTVVIDAGGPGFGDRGSCGQLCGCNDDCQNKALICNPINNANFTMATGRLGVCSDPTDSNGMPAMQLPCN